MLRVVKIAGGEYQECSAKDKLKKKSWSWRVMNTVFSFFFLNAVKKNLRNGKGCQRSHYVSYYLTGSKGEGSKLEMKREGHA